MGVLTSGFVHARPSARPPINMRGNFPGHMSAESPSSITPNPQQFHQDFQSPPKKLQNTLPVRNSLLILKKKQDILQFLSFLVTDPLTHSHWQFLEGPLPLKKERSNTKLNTKIINVENNKKCNQKMPIKYNNNLMYAKVVFIQILKIIISGVFLFLFSPLSAIVTCLIYIRY